MPETGGLACLLRQLNFSIGHAFAQVLIGLQRLAIHVFADRDLFVVMASLGERGQRLDLGVVVTGVEQREGVTLLTHTAHPVRGGHECACRHDFQHVADIDHEGIGNRWCIDPLAQVVHHFQARLVGQQDGEALVVSMGANAWCVLGRAVEGVVNQAQLGRRAGDHAVEVVFFQAQGQGEATEQAPAEGEDRFVVSPYRFLETRQLRPVVGPQQGRVGQHQWVVGWHFEADVEGFLVVRLALGVNLFAFRHETLVGLRGADVVLHLGVEGLVEIVLGGLAQVGDQLWVDAMIGDVEKTDLAGGAAQLFGNGQAMFQLKAEQAGDVHDRDALEVGFLCVCAVVVIVRHDATAP
ncbi:hypothetical protein D9M71_443440 [compost metagenome]